MNVSDARKKFCQGLVGSWASYLGGGRDMLIGMRLTFHENGSGTIEEWGFDHEHLDPSYVSIPDFQWEFVADSRIEITHRGVTKIVDYDFRTCTNEYGIAELRVFETGRSPDEHGEIGFWLSPYSLVYLERGQEAFSIVRRLWKWLKY